MNTHHLCAAALVAVVTVANAATTFAVTVEIAIESKGEPVPGTTITFETVEGDEISLVELTPTNDGSSDDLISDDEATTTLETETATGTPQDGEPAAPSQQATDVPAVPEGATDESQEAQQQPVPSGQLARLEDDFLGQDVIIVVRKDGEVVKRQPARLDREASRLTIEAFDPADARLSLSVSQPKPCRRGDRCIYNISVENAGVGIYNGPLFLAGTLYGRVAKADWLCADTGRDQQICHLPASIEPGASLSWSVDVSLPRRIPAGARNCLEIIRLDSSADGRRDPLLQLVQHGLNRAEFGAGQPDGLMGPRTRAAIAAFSADAGLAETVSLPTIYRVLYNQDLDDLGRLQLTGGRTCSALALVPEPRPQTVTKTQRRPTAAAPDNKEVYDYSPSVDIGISIGTGVFGKRHREGRGRQKDRDRRLFED